MQPFSTQTSAVAATGPGTLWIVNITGPGSGSSTVTIYDSLTATGTVLFNGDGATEMNYQMAPGGDQGLNFKNGLYISLAGSTKPICGVIFQQ